MDSTRYLNSLREISQAQDLGDKYLLNNNDGTVSVKRSRCSLMGHCWKKITSKLNSCFYGDTDMQKAGDRIAEMIESSIKTNPDLCHVSADVFNQFARRENNYYIKRISFVPQNPSECEIRIVDKSVETSKDSTPVDTNSADSSLGYNIEEVVVFTETHNESDSGEPDVTDIVVTEGSEPKKTESSRFVDMDFYGRKTPLEDESAHIEVNKDQETTEIVVTEGSEQKQSERSRFIDFDFQDNTQAVLPKAEDVRVVVYESKEMRMLKNSEGFKYAVSVVTEELFNKLVTRNSSFDK